MGVHFTITDSLKPHGHDDGNLIGESRGGRGGSEDPGTSFILQLHQNLFRIDHIEGLDQISRIKPNLKRNSGRKPPRPLLWHLQNLDGWRTSPQNLL